MARTTPFPFHDRHDPEVHSPEINGLITDLIDSYAMALGDCDKSGSIDDASYNEGLAAGYEHVLVELLHVPWADVRAWYNRTVPVPSPAS